MIKPLLKIFLLIFILSISLFNTNNSFAEESESSNIRPFQFSIFGTIGGYGLLYSIGGELLFYRNFGLNIGYTSFDILGETSGKANLKFIPMYASYYFGGNHRFYLEAGANYVRIKAEHYSNDDYEVYEGKGSGFSPIGGLGYNYCPKDDYFYFKAGPSFFLIDGEFFVWGGISAGMTF